MHLTGGLLICGDHCILDMHRAWWSGKAPTLSVQGTALPGLRHVCLRSDVMRDTSVRFSP